MACRTCSKNKKSDNGYMQQAAIDWPPFNTVDLKVYDQGEVRNLSREEWDNDRHKLLLFFPETFTPVCTTEMGNLNDWIPEFDKLGVDVFAATTDPIHAVKDWYENEEAIKNPKYKVLSTYIMPARIGIMNGGRSKRASVFISKDGDMIIQEHFLKVGRNLKELHRTFYGYTTDSYCAEGWEDPSDGFLTKDNA